MNELIGIKGWIELQHFDKNGNLIEKRNINNTVTNAGKAAIAGLANGVVTTPFTYIALGTGTSEITETSTALTSEITTNGGARASATCSRTTTTVTNDTAQLEHTFNFTGSLAISETGVFDSASGGTMLSGTTMSTLNVASGDSLTLTWKIKFS